MDYLLHVATVILLYAGLVASLNLLIGHAGILSFAHASFYGIGAYVTAMLTVYAGWDWLPAVAAAVVATAAAVAATVADRLAARPTAAIAGVVVCNGGAAEAQDS